MPRPLYPAELASMLEDEAMRQRELRAEARFNEDEMGIAVTTTLAAFCTRLSQQVSQFGEETIAVRDTRTGQISRAYARKVQGNDRDAAPHAAPVLQEDDRGAGAVPGEPGAHLSIPRSSL